MDRKKTLKAQTLSDYASEYRKLKRKMASLNEVLGPFVLHGMALDVAERSDILAPVSKKGVSALCIGAFQSLLEEVDPEYFPMVKEFQEARKKLLKCVVARCKRIQWRGGYCKKCFQEVKVGKMEGRPIVPNEKCVICDRKVPKRMIFCKECEEWKRTVRMDAR